MAKFASFAKFLSFATFNHSEHIEMANNIAVGLAKAGHIHLSVLSVLVVFQTPPALTWLTFIWKNYPGYSRERRRLSFAHSVTIARHFRTCTQTPEKQKKAKIQLGWTFSKKFEFWSVKFLTWKPQKVLKYNPFFLGCFWPLLEKFSPLHAEILWSSLASPGCEDLDTTWPGEVVPQHGREVLLAEKKVGLDGSGLRNSLNPLLTFGFPKIVPQVATYGSPPNIR